MKKKIGITAAIFLVAFFIWRHQSSSEDKQGVKIGILQLVSHPALNQAREGFIAKIKESGQEIEIVVQNAEGSMLQARCIAQSYHANPSIKGVFAIGTAAAQAAVSLEKDKPVIFSAITDPIKAGIVQENSCGTSDYIDIPKEIEVLRTLFPNAKKIAIPFNPAEVNSTCLVEIMKKELIAKGLEPMEMGIHHESEVAVAIAKASILADVFLLPTDNLLAGAFPVLVKTAQQYGKAVVVSDNLLVAKGAIAARGVDYYESGKKAAEMAIDVLIKGKNPKDIPLHAPKESKIILNEKKIAEMGFEMPAIWQDQIVLK